MDAVEIGGAVQGRPRAEGPETPGWYVLWTQSHCEQLVHDQLRARGFELLLPTREVWSRRGHVRHQIRTPLFPGYLFVHHALDKTAYAVVRSARGLVGVLGEPGSVAAQVPDVEIDAIRRLVHTRTPALPHPYLRQGCRVRITRGPLADLEGIFVRSKAHKGLVVISVNMLQRSAAVEVDCTLVAVA